MVNEMPKYDLTVAQIMDIITYLKIMRDQVSEELKEAIAVESTLAIPMLVEDKAKLDILISSLKKIKL